MLATATSFGPKGRLTFKCKDDTVVYIVKMGGPKVALDTNNDEWMNEWLSDALDNIWLRGNNKNVRTRMEILTVCDRFKFVIGNAQTATVDPDLSPVVNILNWWGFCSQVAGQSRYVLTALFYLVRLAFSITEKSAVQCDQTVILERQGHGDVLLKFQWYWMKTECAV